MRKPRTQEHNDKIRAAHLARGQAAQPFKKCPRCTKILPRATAFKKEGKRTKSYCIECERSYGAERQRKHMATWDETRREKHRKMNRSVCLRRYHGITLDDFEAMERDQEGRCAICKKPRQKGDRNLNVDHDHSTMRIRGLLCDPCNRGIGLLKESEEIMKSAIEYLLFHQRNPRDKFSNGADAKKPKWHLTSDVKTKKK